MPIKLNTLFPNSFSSLESISKDDSNNNTRKNQKPEFEIPTALIAKREDFNFIKLVGRGNFGKVFLVNHSGDNKQYALKILNKNVIFSKGEENHVMNERNILIINQQQPFVTSLYYSFQTDEELFLVMEYVTGGELFYYIQNQRNDIEKHAEFYAAEIAVAVGYLHSKNIIYRDLKPENILLDAEGHIVLTDFGLCTLGKPIAEGVAHSFCGTREYLAPEVITKKKYDKSVDWWGFGAILYEIFCGVPPFYSTNVKKLYASIVKKPLKFRSDLNENAQNILTKLLEKNPKHRLGSGKRDVKDVQEHKFFHSINWDNIRNKQIEPPFKPTSILTNPDYDACCFKNNNASCENSKIRPSIAISTERCSKLKILSGFSYSIPSSVM